MPRSGQVVWERDFKKDFGAKTPTWGFAGHPLLDGQKLICLVGGQGSLAMAFDKDTGKELWRAQRPGTGILPAHVDQRRRGAPGHHLGPRVGQCPRSRHRKSVLWTQPWRIQRGAQRLAQPRQAGDSLLLTGLYNGAHLFRPDPGNPTPSLVWQSDRPSEKNTDKLHSIISTPFVENGYIYGVCSYGQLRCLKLESGERLWETLAATTADGKETRWANAFLIKQGNRFFLANEKGDLIIARLTPSATRKSAGRAPARSHESRPTPRQWSGRIRPSANRCIYARNDREKSSAPHSRN